MHNLCSGSEGDTSENIDFEGKIIFETDCITCIFNINYTKN